MWKMLRSEWIKFLTYHWCVIGLLIAIFLPAFALLFSENVQELLKQPEALIAFSLRFQYLGQTGIIVAMAGYWGQEYSNASLRTTLLAVPSRIKLLLVKKIIILSNTVIAGILCGILFLLVLLVKSQDDFTFELAVKLMIKTFIGLVSWLLLGFISANLAILTQSFVVPMSVLFPMILGLSQMLLALTNLAKYLPDLAGMNLFLLSEQKLFLNSLNGISVQLIWVVFLASISVYSFCHRDIR